MSIYIAVIFMTTIFSCTGYFITSAKYGIIGEPFHFYCYISGFIGRPEIYRNGNRSSDCNRYTNDRYSAECTDFDFPLYNLTLTIPGENMTDEEDQSVWHCKSRYRYSRNILFNFTLTVAVPIESATIYPKANISKQRSIVFGHSTTVQCQVTDVRPPAKFQWFIDSERVYDPSLFTVSVTGSDMTRYNVTSTLSLRSDKYKNFRKVRCIANNMEKETAAKSDETTIEFMYPPSESPTIEGYSTGQRLFLNDPSLSLICKVETSWPKSTLDFACLQQKQVTEDTKDYVVRRITVDVSEQLNGQSCACAATHPAGDYKKKAHITFTVIDPAELNVSSDKVDIVKAGIAMTTLGATFFALSAVLMVIWKRLFCQRKCQCLHTEDQKDTIEDRQMDYIAENYEVLQRPPLTSGSTTTLNKEKRTTFTDSSEVYINTTLT